MRDAVIPASKARTSLWPSMRPPHGRHVDFFGPLALLRHTPVRSLTVKGTPTQRLDQIEGGRTRCYFVLGFRPDEPRTPPAPARAQLATTRAVSQPQSSPATTPPPTMATAQ